MKQTSSLGLFISLLPIRICAFLLSFMVGMVILSSCEIDSRFSAQPRIVVIKPAAETGAPMCRKVELPKGLTTEQMVKAALEEDKGVTNNSAFTAPVQNVKQMLTETFPKMLLALISPGQPESGEGTGIKDVKQVLSNRLLASVVEPSYKVIKLCPEQMQWESSELVAQSIQ